MAEPDWIQMLKSAVDRAGSIQAVADMLDVSRTMVSLVVGGKYERSTTNLEKRVLARLDFVACPHLGAEIARKECDGHRSRQMPKSDPAKLRHWVACQRCVVHKAALADADEARRSA